MDLKPPKRTFSEDSSYRGPKDVDAAQRVNKLKAILWAVGPGAFLGAVLGSLMGHFFLGLIGGVAFVYFMVMGISGGAGRGVSSIYMPSGAIGSRRKEYSRAEALSVRGAFEEAVRAYEVAILEDPEEVEPYLRIARIFRDELEDYGAALEWFRRAEREADLSGGRELLARREIAEVYLHHMREPRKAAPELARLRDGFPGTLEAEWAEGELARIKEEMAKEAGPDQGGSSLPPS
ncbi:tetratricopeptide repeat protein [Gemmatimonadota bacterium]